MYRFIADTRWDQTLIGVLIKLLIFIKDGFNCKEHPDICNMTEHTTGIVYKNFAEKHGSSSNSSGRYYGGDGL